MTDWVVDAQNLTKTYRMGEIDVHALNGVTVQIRRSEVIAIMGPSGSGKSTLMNILGCLDRPTSGEYSLDGESVKGLSDDQLSAIRNRKVGFIFQGFNLLNRSTALTNVELPMHYAGKRGRIAKERAKAALEAVGLGDRIHHRPNELSGGQQQRVAIARALVTDPLLVIADEPTGDLDRQSAADILKLLDRLNVELGKSIVMVTHDPRAAEAAHHLIYLDKGQLTDTAPAH